MFEKQFWIVSSDFSVPSSMERSDASIVGLGPCFASREVMGALCTKDSSFRNAASDGIDTRKQCNAKVVDREADVTFVALAVFEVRLARDSREISPEKNADPAFGLGIDIGNVAFPIGNVASGAMGNSIAGEYRRGLEVVFVTDASSELGNVQSEYQVGCVV